MSTILSDKEYDTIYTDISNCFPETLDAALSIIHAQAIEPLTTREHLLEIGPGPGIMTRTLARSFAHTSIVEPNPDFRLRNQNEGYTVYTDLFQEVELPHQYDMVLCSYVLYHVDRDLWPVFIEKMTQTLRPGGIGMIVMGASRGYHYDFRTTFHPECVHGGMAIDILREQGTPFQVVEHIDSYTTSTLEHMEQLCHFSIVESCFSPEEFEAMNPQEKEAMEQKLRRFAAEQQRDENSYTLTYEVDFISIHRPA